MILNGIMTDDPRYFCGSWPCYYCTTTTICYTNSASLRVRWVARWAELASNNYTHRLLDVTNTTQLRNGSPFCCSYLYNDQWRAEHPGTQPLATCVRIIIVYYANNSKQEGRRITAVSSSLTVVKYPTAWNWYSRWRTRSTKTQPCRSYWWPTFQRRRRRWRC